LLRFGVLLGRDSEALDIAITMVKPVGPAHHRQRQREDNMAKTITLPADLPAHPIFLSLRTSVGIDACWWTICLLTWAAQYRPDGNLEGMTDDDITLAAGVDKAAAYALGAAGSSVVRKLHEAGVLVGDMVTEGALRISDELLPKRSRGNAGVPSCPVQEIVALYEKHLPMLAKVRALGTATEAAVRNAWKASEDRQSLDWWVNYFEHVAKNCPFLIGKADTVFYADFAWLVGPKNMEKVINGRYDRA
jgi:hypothetical protein